MKSKLPTLASVMGLYCVPILWLIIESLTTVQANNFQPQYAGKMVIVYTLATSYCKLTAVSRSGHSYDTTVTQEKTEACTHTHHPMLGGRGHSHVSRFPKSNCHLPEISVRTTEKVREQTSLLLSFVCF